MKVHHCLVVAVLTDFFVAEDKNTGDVHLLHYEKGREACAPIEDKSHVSNRFLPKGTVPKKDDYVYLKKERGAHTPDFLWAMGSDLTRRQRRGKTGRHPTGSYRVAMSC